MALRKLCFLQAFGSQEPYTFMKDKLGQFDGSAFETPDFSHRDFGQYITQVYDVILRNMCFAFTYTGTSIAIGAYCLIVNG